MTSPAEKRATNWDKLQPVLRSFARARYNDSPQLGPLLMKVSNCKSSLIKLNPEMGTDCKQAKNRAAVETEREDTVQVMRQSVLARIKSQEAGRNDQPRLVSR